MDSSILRRAHSSLVASLRACLSRERFRVPPNHLESYSAGSIGQLAAFYPSERIWLYLVSDPSYEGLFGCWRGVAVSDKDLT